MLPSLFISHGAPSFPLTDADAKPFLAGLAARLPERPKAILIISAHWETDGPTVNDVAINDTIHDFYGFPAELYALHYPAPGSHALVERVTELLGAGGLPVVRDGARGLDHGAWVPLRLIYPDADIPVVQLSLQTALGPDHHLRLGTLLRPLRSEGVLIIGSGSLTHDLASFRDYRHALHAPAPDWVSQFADWMATRLAAGDIDAVRDYRQLAPFAQRNHPSEEHLLPLFVALGTATNEPAHHLHQSTTYGILRMDAFGFGRSIEAEPTEAPQIST